MIEAIAGVDHIIDLKMGLSGNIESESEQHLVASGKHEVNCRFQA